MLCEDRNTESDVMKSMAMECRLTRCSMDTKIFEERNYEMKRIITISTMAVLVAVMVFSIGKIVGYHAESAQNQNNIKELITEKDSEAENYRKQKEKNPDIIVWIKIPGTKIDYPVM